jgi:dolichol kinase
MVLENMDADGKTIHIRRKVFHLCLGTVFIISFIYMDLLKWFFLAVLGLGVILSFLQSKRNLPVITWFLERYDKNDDQVPGQGPLTFFTGSVLVWFLFPGEIALASLIVLTFGDPIAYLAGKLIKGPDLPWNGNKTIIGSISFMIIPFILISFMFSFTEAIIISIAGSAMESMKYPRSLLFDDNITIPIGAAMVSWLLSLLLGIF